MQSPSLTQEITARANLGFGDSFTTAQLLALSSTESNRLRFAFCSDCFTSGATTGQLVGDLCLWIGNRWVTYSDRVGLWADPNWPQWALEIARSGVLVHGPFLSAIGDAPFANFSSGLTSYTSGSGASLFVPNTDGPRVLRYHSTPGTTSTGSFRGLCVFGFSNSTAAPSRKAALVMSYIGIPEATSAVGFDEWHWRLVMQSQLFTASAALQADEIGFVMDDRNSLGQGASGANLRAMVRLNSATTHWVDTGIPATTGQAFLVATWEPTGPAATRGRVRLCSAGDFGSGFTTHVDTTSTAATTVFQPGLVGAKTLGTGSRLTGRRFIRSILYRTTADSGGTIS